MTGVEERLSELLRAAAPRSTGVPFDAVEREVGRRRVVRLSVAASVAAVAVVAITVPLFAASGDGSYRERLSTKPAVSLAGAVPWIDAPAPPYRPPAGVTPAPPATDARPCAVGDVSARLVDGDGAGGHEVRYVRFRNVSPSTCVLKGYPRVVATEPGHPDVAASDGSFFPAGRTANMRPGADTLLGLETDTACSARPGGGPAGPAYHHVDITLPRGGGTIGVDDPAGGFDVTCGLHLTRFFVKGAAVQPVTPPDPLNQLQVSLELPPTVAAGDTLGYVADLTNLTDHAIRLDPCPGYVESASGTPTPVKQVYALNCRPVGHIAAGDTTRFAMRLRIPAQTPGGPLTIHWTLAVPSAAVTAEATVNVRSAHGARAVTGSGATVRGATVSGVLRLTGGPAGAAQPGVPGAVTFTGSGGRHYSAKARVDGSFATSVPPGQYTVTGTSPLFDGGNGVCRADRPVSVPGSGVSGVVVACSRR